ncbi:methyl-accepting chemotaxis protein [Marinobacter sp. SS21]|uniref:methyl-accepting chemotaxis protein n=1 Tax=Marinobacter sp. SS21 TaxID=2979460 RepID=UPI00232EC768|nr:methyl-accepting chemotaxis protein [Marinobacter sp. SS21]MDC0663417.1 methyl-accepting chemotaxis protein [Marinobacter sp. SS21]
MKAYFNLKTATKLGLAFGLLLVLFVAVMLMAQRGMVSLQESQQRLTEEHLASFATIKDLRIDINTARAILLAASLVQDQEPTGEVVKEDEIREIVQKKQQHIDRLRRLNHDNVETLQIVSEMERVLDQLHTQNGHVIQLIKTGNYSEAHRLLLDTRQQIYQFRDLSKLGTKRIEAEMNELLLANLNLIDRQRQATLAAGTGSLALIAMLIWLTTRAIAQPLGQLTQWADRIATGDLMAESSLEQRRDEVGYLSLAFARMGNYLRDLAEKAELIAQGDLTVVVTPRSDQDVLGKTFATMVANLQQLAAELQEGTSVLATSSQEILSSTSQVSSSAQETATSISEITTTVEEVKQTASLASQKAKHVTEAAQRTVKVSQEGRRSVETFIQSMAEIREQMQAVADSIVRLSEQSQAIGDIVASVSDLAEQTNMLGVNASIEAVKAGEHGKGFSVVAQEVKTLAAQSRQATAQVRTILMDIQKAMNSAVMVVEQSDKAVEGGFQQIKESGETIRTLAESIDDSSGAALQIASSSQQQLVGMDQIAVAMGSIKQASQDNVQGTRQSEQAARNLHELGQRLKERVAQFKT